MPAVAETIPGFTATGWQVLVAPLGTPEAVVNKASETLLAVVRDPELRQILAKRGAYTRPMSPAETMAFVQAEQQKWKPAIERIACQRGDIRSSRRARPPPPRTAPSRPG